jgi:hypothetical protein
VHQQRLKGNPIAFYIKGMLIAASIMFFFNGLAPLLFPSGSWALTLTGNPPLYFLSVIAAAFFAGTTSFSIAPHIKPIYFVLASLSIGLTALAINIATLQMTTSNEYGMVNRHIPDATLHLQNIMMLLSFVPSGAGMIYHALKSNFAIKGIFFAGGILLTGISVTLAYDTQDKQVFTYFAIASLIGWVLLIASFIMFKNETGLTRK